jgi:hypothetical protein
MTAPTWPCPAGWTTTGFEICHYRSALAPDGYPCQRVCVEEWRRWIKPEMEYECGWCGAKLVLEHFDTCPICGVRVRWDGGGGM